eukprot:1850019-Prymnesium_polylepis.1
MTRVDARDMHSASKGRRASSATAQPISAPPSERHCWDHTASVARADVADASDKQSMSARGCVASNALHRSPLGGWSCRAACEHQASRCTGHSASPQGRPDDGLAGRA